MSSAKVILRPSYLASRGVGLPLFTRSVYFPLMVKSSGLRSFHDTPNKQNTTLGNVNFPPHHNNTTTTTTNESNSITAEAVKNLTTPLHVNQTEYLKDFTVSEVFSNLVIGLCTLNKPILNFCIKIFPYTPIPIIKALVYKIYCGGETIDQVKQAGTRLAERGINNMMISLTIEACEGNDNIDPAYIVSETAKSVNEILVPHTLKVIQESGKDINSIPPGYVALKPTGFAEDAAKVLKFFKTDPKYAQEFEELVEKVSTICQTIYDANKQLAKQYPQRSAPFVVGVIDAEKHDLQEGVYELQRRLYAKFNKLNEPVSVVGTLQMYLSQSAELLSLEERLAKENNYRLGLKLVRGAYIHSEKNRAEIIHKTQEDTDSNYNQVVASHNGESMKLATSKLQKDTDKENKNKNNVVLGQLLGMADNITHDLIKNHKVDNVIKYVPWGPPLETKEYLLRRLEENGDAVKSNNGFPLVKASASALFKRAFGLA
ncbi:putative proline oxidase mitochondrial precursor [Scheffersomyces coipomensis]|uniref:putative proline oxidase mitochondrial precursor n=1 Tax=Scheffersomyces coipomensis TaxID=1788519 RepID=UPI00315C7639